jgi:hypothetical protein
LGIALTRYVETFSWTGNVQLFLDSVVKECPILNVCSGRTKWGHVTVDKYESADVTADWTSLPFKSDSFGAVFADPPWNAGYKREVAAFIQEALRVAPVAYLLAPWIYGAHWLFLESAWVREYPGVQQPVLLSRYVRKDDLGVDARPWAVSHREAIGTIPMFGTGNA